MANGKINYYTLLLFLLQTQIEKYTGNKIYLEKRCCLGNEKINNKNNQYNMTCFVQILTFFLSAHALYF